MKKILLSLCLILISSSVFAFRLTPMVVDFDSVGRGATQTFQVDNNGDKEVALEVDSATRDVNIDGIESRQKTTDFMIYPVQLTVKAGEKKNIRVTYIGGKTEKEKSYRLIVRQLPVNLEKNKIKGSQSQINFLFEYMAAVYVKADTKINQKVELKKVKKEGDKVVLTVDNVGYSHLFFKEFIVTLSGADEKIDLDMNEKEYEDAGGINLLVGKTRNIKIPIPTKMKNKKFTVSLKYKSI